VRLTNPGALATFAVDGPPLQKVAWDTIDWKRVARSLAFR